jgi:hypothetical protein
MRFTAAPALAGVLALAACGEPSSTQMLQTRASVAMSPTQTCNSQAIVEQLPNGTRVRLPDTTLFVIGRTDLSPCGQFALASVVEAMLNPAIMQVAVEPGADIDAPQAAFPRERAEHVRKFLSNVGFSPDQPPVVVQPSPVPSTHWGIVLSVVGKG